VWSLLFAELLNEFPEFYGMPLDFYGMQLDSKGSNMITGQIVWDLWRRMWHWCKFGFPSQLSFYQMLHISKSSHH
jgi:hypothetical protein